jgi:glycosyltransferase involved in cell wall biosynthesis
MSVPTDERRPDLAILIPSYAGGGGERVALFIARSLADAGLGVDLVVARSTGELRDLPIPGVRRVELGALNEMLALRRWVRYLKRTRPRSAMSLIHTANFNSGLGAVFAPNVPVIVNLRIALDCDPSAQWWLRRQLGFGPERRLYRRAARVVGVSKGVSDEAERILGLDAARVVSIPNPVKSMDDSATVAEEHESFFEKPVVLGTGRLAQQKDFVTLIDAVSQTVDHHDVNLVILGEGPERDALGRHAEARGLSGRIFMPGFVPDPRPYMQRSRVFVLSSRNEGFPNALLEAMAVGTAVISTDCPFGPRELLDEGRFGSLVPVGDVAGLTRALGAELDAPDVGIAARNASRAEWMGQYDPDVIARRYLDLVRDVILESETAMLPDEVIPPHEDHRHGWRGVHRR